jgi:hypothetical protein
MPDSPDHRAAMHQLAQQRRKDGLPRWDRTIQLGDVFHNEDMTFEQRRDAIVARVRESGWRIDGVLEDLLEELSDAEDSEEFGEQWDEIYDLADEDRVWIETIAQLQLFLLLLASQGHHREEPAMTGRSAKTMLAYVPDLPGTVVTWKTAGDYTHVGLVYNWQSSEWQIVAKGWSPESIAKTAKTAGRKMYAHALQFADRATVVTRLHEATAPIIAEYFGGDHRLKIVSVFRPETGWETVNWHAGRSLLRHLDREGVTAIAVSGPYDGQSYGRTADFQMTEIVKSLNSRRASV